MGRQKHCVGERIQVEIMYEIGTVGRCSIQEEAPSVLSFDLTSLTGSAVVLINAFGIPKNSDVSIEEKEEITDEGHESVEDAFYPHSENDSDVLNSQTKEPENSGITIHLDSENPLLTVATDEIVSALSPVTLEEKNNTVGQSPTRIVDERVEDFIAGCLQAADKKMPLGSSMGRPVSPKGEDSLARLGSNQVDEEILRLQEEISKYSAQIGTLKNSISHASQHFMIEDEEDADGSMGKDKQKQHVPLSNSCFGCVALTPESVEFGNRLGESILDSDTIGDDFKARTQEMYLGKQENAPESILDPTTKDGVNPIVLARKEKMIESENGGLDEVGLDVRPDSIADQFSAASYRKAMRSLDGLSSEDFSSLLSLPNLPLSEEQRINARETGRRWVSLPARRKKRSAGRDNGFRGALASTRREKQPASRDHVLRRALRLPTSLRGSGSESGSNSCALHEVCARPDVTLHELEKALSSNPEAVSMKDGRGRLPLHILGDNDRLLGDTNGRKVATDFCRKLMEIYPEAITIPDLTGRMPFISILQDWVQWAHVCHENSTTTLATDRSPLDRMHMMCAGSFDSELRTSDRAPTSRNLYINMFPEVSVWYEADWCLSMLSLGIDKLAQASERLRKQRSRSLSTKNQNECAALATHLVEAVPGLLKTLLLSEGSVCNHFQNRFQRLSVLRRSLLRPESIGPWLTVMLRKGGAPSFRAVDYLFLLSTTTVEDYAGHSISSFTSEDEKKYEEERSSVFNAVEALEDIVTSLVGLEETEAERAASSSVIWHALNMQLRRPFIISLVLIDLILHIVLLVAYQTYLGPNQFGLPVAPAWLIMAITSHYMIRFFLQAISLWNLSPKIFRSYFANAWTILSIVTQAMMLLFILLFQNYPGALGNGYKALLVGLLWLEVLNFLKVVNKTFATFILALFQILRGLKSFLVVFLVVIIMFSDMLRVALRTKDDGNYCTDNAGSLSPPAEDFCSITEIDGIIRVYSLLIGDVALDDWKETTGMAVLFVMVTVFGMIILLNILIAVICDAYEGARLKSVLLFGRSRIIFVAQNRALESFLQPGTNPSGNLTHRAVAMICGFLRCLLLISLISTAGAVNAYLIRDVILGNGDDFVFIIDIILAVILSFALTVMIIFATSVWIRKVASDRVLRAVKSVEKHLSTVLGFLSSYVFGEKTNHLQQVDTLGRLEVMERAIEEQLASAKASIVQEMNDMERRFNECTTQTGEDSRATDCARY